MKIGNTKVDFETLRIEGPAGRCTIEPKVMALLRVLTENAGQVMSRDSLIDQVWGVEFGGDERLSRAISILRKALGDERGQHTHIQTISRRGYQLIAKVTEDDGGLSANVTAKVIPKIETADISDAPVIETSLSAKPKKSLGRRMVLGAASLAATLMIVASVIALRPSGYISVQASMAEGLAHIENFTAKDAIEDAQDIFGIILVDNPDHAAARAGLALALMREYTHLERDPALLQRATATAEAALRADEHLALANIAAAWAAEFNGELEQAHKSLDRADILDPNNILALEGRARVYNKQGLRDEVQTALETALLHYPNHALFHLYMGEFSLYIGEWSNAETAFKQAIILSKDNSRAYAQLGQALHLQDKTSEAIAIIQDGLKVNETALLYNNLGTYLFFQGQYDIAAKAFKKTIELEGDSHDHLYWANLGDSYRWSKGQTQDANQAYRRALQLLQIQMNKVPDNLNLQSHAALFNAKLGDFKAAQSALENVLTQDKLPSIQYYRAAVSYEIMADRTQALTMLGHAIAANYPMTEILNDPELANLRQDPAYHRLLSQLTAQQEGKDL